MINTPNKNLKVTENYFEKNFSHYTNMDGYVGFCSTAGGIIATEVEKVTLNKIEENKYENWKNKFKVIFYC